MFLLSLNEISRDHGPFLCCLSSIHPLSRPSGFTLGSYCLLSITHSLPELWTTCLEMEADVLRASNSNRMNITQLIDV